MFIFEQHVRDSILTVIFDAKTYKNLNVFMQDQKGILISILLGASHEYTQTYVFAVCSIFSKNKHFIQLLIYSQMSTQRVTVGSI